MALIFLFLFCFAMQVDLNFLQHFYDIPFHISRILGGHMYWVVRAHKVY